MFTLSDGVLCWVVRHTSGTEDSLLAAWPIQRHAQAVCSVTSTIFVCHPPRYSLYSYHILSLSPSSHMKTPFTSFIPSGVDANPTSPLAELVGREGNNTCDVSKHIHNFKMTIASYCKDEHSLWALRCHPERLQATKISWMQTAQAKCFLRVLHLSVPLPCASTSAKLPPPCSAFVSSGVHTECRTERL